MPRTCPCTSDDFLRLFSSQNTPVVNEEYLRKVFEPFGGLIDVVVKHSMQEQLPNSNQVHKQHGYAFFLMENSQSASHLLQSLQTVHNNNIENVRYDGKITNTLHKNGQHQAGQASTKDRHILYQNHSSSSGKQVVPSNKDAWVYPSVPSAVAVAEKHRTMLAMMQQAGAGPSVAPVTYTLAQAAPQLHGPPSLVPTVATVVTPSSSPEASSTPSTSTTSSLSTHSSGSGHHYSVHAYAHPHFNGHGHGHAHQVQHHHHHSHQAMQHAQPAHRAHAQPVVHSNVPPLMTHPVVGQQFLSSSPPELRGIPVVMVPSQSPRSPSQQAAAQPFGPPSPPHHVNGQSHAAQFAPPQFPAAGFFPPMPVSLPMMPSSSGAAVGSAHMMVSPFPPMAYANANPQPTMMMVQSSGSSPPGAQPVVTPVFAYHHQQQQQQQQAPAVHHHAPQPPSHHQYQLHHLPHHPQHHMQMPSPHGYAPAMH